MHNHKNAITTGSTVVMCLVIGLVMITFGQVTGILGPTATPTFDADAHATLWAGEVTAWAREGWIISTATPRASGQAATPSLTPATEVGR